MRPKPPALPSALARREAARSLLAGSLDCRDAQAVFSFTGQWVHRQGMASLPALMAELAQGEALLWWQALLQQSVETVGLNAERVGLTTKPVGLTTKPLSLSVVAVGLAAEPPAATDPAPSGSLQPAAIQPATIQALEPPAQELQAPELEGGQDDPALSPLAGIPAAQRGPEPGKGPAAELQPGAEPMAIAATAPPAPRPVVAKIRRGASSNRPAPAPRNPELARLRAWLPDNDFQGGASRRSHAA